MLVCAHLNAFVFFMQHQLADKVILVVGDIMLDRYWVGSTSRTSPEAPIPIVNVNDREQRVGGCGNVALNLKTLGAKPRVLSMVGEDDDAQRLAELLDEHAVDHTLVPMPGHPTTVKLRVLSHGQQMLRMDFEKKCPDIDKSVLLSAFEQHLDQADVVILSDYAKGVLADPQPFIQLAKQHNKLIFVDPKRIDFEAYSGATVIKPNEREFEAVVGECPTDEILEEKANELLEQIDCEALMITRGGKGMTLVQRGRRARHIPSLSKELVDVTGAGDTVIASFSLAVTAGYSMLAAMYLSNLAASIVVGKVGTATLTLDELLAAYSKLRMLPKGVVERERLAKAVRDAQQPGKDVVFTNGCFDILHIGHVAYLEKAKQQGDILIVAINSDDSIKRLKGPDRPLVPLESRMHVLAALECVDWVVSFDEDTPEALLELLQPSILVKGTDYTVDQIVGADIVLGYGGQVKRIEHDFTAISTTKLLNRKPKSP